MRHAIAPGGLIYHLDLRRTVEPDFAHLLESVFSRQRNPSLDPMSLRIYSGQICVIGEIDLSHLCRLRFGLPLRFSAWQIDGDEYQRKRGREEQMFVGAGVCHQTSPLMRSNQFCLVQSSLLRQRATSVYPEAR